MLVMQMTFIRFIFGDSVTDGDLACRRQQLHEHDLVNQLQLSSFAKSKLQQCAQIHGQSFHHSMQGLDSTISQQLQRMTS